MSKSIKMPLLALSTGWQPNGRALDALLLAQECGVGIEIQRVYNQQELDLVCSLVRSGEVAAHSLHALAKPFQTQISNCFGDEILSSEPARRARAWDMIRESAEIVSKLGISYMVIHGGELTPDYISEKWTRNSFQSSGEKVTQLRRWRESQIDRVVDSIVAGLSKIACEFPDISIGLENRNSYWQSPSLCELKRILAALPPRVGFWHDLAHSRSLQDQGITARQAWVNSIPSDRLFGVHVQDSSSDGCEHLCLGAGDDIIPRELYALGRVCVLEVAPLPINTSTAVRESLQFLYRAIGEFHGEDHTLKSVLSDQSAI